MERIKGYLQNGENAEKEQKGEKMSKQTKKQKNIIRRCSYSFATQNQISKLFKGLLLLHLRNHTIFSKTPALDI